MKVLCFCGEEFITSTSTECPKCGEIIVLREAGETQEEFEERWTLFRELENEIHSLPISDF